MRQDYAPAPYALSFYARSEAKRTPASRRLFSVVIAGGVQILFITAIASGLMHPVIQQYFGPLNVDFVADKTKTSPDIPPPAPTIADDPLIPTAPPDVVFTPPDTSVDTGGIIIASNVPATPALAVTPPQPLSASHSKPLYPPVSRRLGEEGVVQLKLTIAEDGSVREAMVAKSSGHARLDQAAAAWVKANWRYTPAMKGGNPVVSTTTAQVNFELK